MFPSSERKPTDAEKAVRSACAHAGISVKPKRGDAILFWSLTPEGRKDTASLHAGCPVIRGVKHSATQWVRVRAFAQ